MTFLVPNLTCKVAVTLGEKFGGVCATAAVAAKRSVARVVRNMVLKCFGWVGEMKRNEVPWMEIEVWNRRERRG